MPGRHALELALMPLPCYLGLIPGNLYLQIVDGHIHSLSRSRRVVLLQSCASTIRRTYSAVAVSV